MLFGTNCRNFPVFSSVLSSLYRRKRPATSDARFCLILSTELQKRPHKLPDMLHLQLLQRCSGPVYASKEADGLTLCHLSARKRDQLCCASFCGVHFQESTSSARTGTDEKQEKLGNGEQLKTALDCPG